MHPLLRAAAERQWGLFTASDAHRAGYSPAQVRDLLGPGQWRGLRRGVYMTATRLAAVDQAKAGYRANCVAVLLELGRPDAAISHGSAARLWGVPLPRGLDPTIRLVAVVDAWFEEAALAVEFDGRVKYTDPWRDRDPGRILWEEKRREDELRALDIRVVRMADHDVVRGWPRMEAQLRHRLATPGPTTRRFAATPRTKGRRRAG